MTTKEIKPASYTDLIHSHGRPCYSDFRKEKESELDAEVVYLVDKLFKNQSRYMFFIDRTSKDYYKCRTNGSILSRMTYINSEDKDGKKLTQYGIMNELPKGYKVDETREIKRVTARYCKTIPFNQDVINSVLQKSEEKFGPLEGVIREITPITEEEKPKLEEGDFDYTVPAVLEPFKLILNEFLEEFIVDPEHCKDKEEIKKQQYEWYDNYKYEKANEVIKRNHAHSKIFRKFPCFSIRNLREHPNLNYDWIFLTVRFAIGDILNNLDLPWNVYFLLNKPEFDDLHSLFPPEIDTYERERNEYVSKLHEPFPSEVTKDKIANVIAGIDENTLSIITSSKSRLIIRAFMYKVIKMVKDNLIVPISITEDNINKALLVFQKWSNFNMDDISEKQLKHNRNSIIYYIILYGDYTEEDTQHTYIIDDEDDEYSCDSNDSENINTAEYSNYRLVINLSDEIESTPYSFNEEDYECEPSENDPYGVALIVDTHRKLDEDFDVIRDINRTTVLWNLVKLYKKKLNMDDGYFLKETIVKNREEFIKEFEKFKKQPCFTNNNILNHPFFDIEDVKDIINHITGCDIRTMKLLEKLNKRYGTTVNIDIFLTYNKNEYRFVFFQERLKFPYFNLPSIYDCDSIDDIIELLLHEDRKTLDRFSACNDITVFDLTNNHVKMRLTDKSLTEDQCSKNYNYGDYLSTPVLTIEDFNNAWELNDKTLLRHIKPSYIVNLYSSKELNNKNMEHLLESVVNADLGVTKDYSKVIKQIKSINKNNFDVYEMIRKYHDEFPKTSPLYLVLLNQLEEFDNKYNSSFYYHVMMMLYYFIDNYTVRRENEDSSKLYKQVRYIVSVMKKSLPKSTMNIDDLYDLFELLNIKMFTNEDVVKSKSEYFINGSGNMLDCE